MSGVNLIVVKDFDKEGTIHVDMSKVKNPHNLFETCVAAAPYWIEVVFLHGRTFESTFDIYAEYAPTKEVSSKELLDSCLTGEYDFGNWIFDIKPKRNGWKYPIPIEGE